MKISIVYRPYNGWFDYTYIVPKTPVRKIPAGENRTCKYKEQDYNKQFSGKGTEL